ncbi:hypothetical protein A3L04_10110 [Thermococcus chitonophagus]|uniref:Mut7-C RNAse domain-containing protein n=1 Tax=Thermococcus chitonophagus TaxID=54262 RepID=A0A160VSM5_9EURY|nr:Mut7-C RNAse domain-containing protein [Thermococcus chitonophagus]ASJ17397.1 hypothetical protein A3L04_10110 [Thermococcus chitonophagus]CUX78035.1 hypothetical protein CHITON_1256 [Thermococcus chitonophagus]
MKFIADMMLGRLARWLRLYGYDTLYGIKEDDKILEVAKKEGRIILTRDSGLAERAKKLGVGVILIESNSFEDQVRQLMGEGIQFNELFPENARCPKCNGPIVRVNKEEIRDKVPKKVYEIYNEFYICLNCGQVYWPGRQWREMVKIDKRIREISKLSERDRQLEAP